MFEGIKSKLGFGDSKDDYGERGYDARYEEDSEDFDEDYSDEFGDEDYDDDYYDDEDSDSSSRYEPYSTVTTRPSRTTTASSPRLVSIDDVRAQTQVPESLLRDPLPERHVTSASSSYRSERTMVDSSDPDKPASRSSTPTPRERSESLNTLFSSTAPSTSASQTVRTSSTSGADSSSSSSSFDPYEAYSGSGTSKHEPSRSVTVLKPISYGEVERVAKVLKAGDVVVLALKNTPDTLSKRILDFSFGVASTLDANVDCIADKVFVLFRGAPLNEAELKSLRTRGVL